MYEPGGAASHSDAPSVECWWQPKDAKIHCPSNLHTPMSIEACLRPSRRPLRAGIRLGITVAWFSASLCGAGVACAAGANASLDISGVWRATQSLPEIKTTSGEQPPLLPQVSAAYARHRALFRRQDLSFDPSSHCRSTGMPRLALMPYAFQIVQRPTVVAFLYSWQRAYRRVDLSGAEPVVDYPQVRGVSVGRVAGTTLVIETSGLADDTYLDAAGMPHSAALRLTEHFQLSPDKNVLTDTMRIDDPKTFAKPWETVIKYRREPAGTELKEDVCIDRLEAGKPAVETKPIDVANYLGASDAGQESAGTTAESFEGTWQSVFVPSPVKVALGSGVLRTVEGPLPPYKPEAEQVFRRRIELEQKGTPLANVDNTCRPHHLLIDLVLTLGPFEIVQTQHQLTFLFEASNSHLTVHLGRRHPADLAPSYRGDAIGRWDGATLIVDTVGFNGKAWLDPSGSPASAAMHWSTRISKVGKTLKFLTTIDDSDYLRPWMVLQTAEPRPEMRLLETDCFDNLRPEDNYRIIYEDFKPPFWDARSKADSVGPR